MGHKPLKTCLIDLGLSAELGVTTDDKKYWQCLSHTIQGWDISHIWDISNMSFFTQKLRMWLDWTPSHMVCFLVTDSGGNSWCLCETEFYDISFDRDVIKFIKSDQLIFESIWNMMKSEKRDCRVWIFKEHKDKNIRNWYLGTFLWDLLAWFLPSLAQSSYSLGWLPL